MPNAYLVGNLAARSTGWAILSLAFALGAACGGYIERQAPDPDAGTVGSGGTSGSAGGGARGGRAGSGETAGESGNGGDGPSRGGTSGGVAGGGNAGCDAAIGGSTFGCSPLGDCSNCPVYYPNGQACDTDALQCTYDQCLIRTCLGSAWRRVGLPC